jgi:CheY-like chemotaxis protein
MWLANEELPDVIITDFQMPQGNGGCLMEWLKSSQRTAEIPVIVLTGRREAGLESKLRHLGAAHFLQKPVSFDDLLRLLKLYIAFAPDEDVSNESPRSPVEV